MGGDIAERSFKKKQPVRLVLARKLVYRKEFINLFHGTYNLTNNK